MNYTISKTARWILFIVIGISFYSCSESNVIGVVVQPQGDKLNLLSVDSITISSSLVLEDSLYADEPIYNLLGSYVDPIFGKAEAGFYTEFAFDEDTLITDSGFKVDSVVLCMAYSGSYGDLSFQQKATIYELSENIYLVNQYYSNSNFSLGNVIANASFVPDLVDSISVDTIKEAPQARIRLAGLESKFQNIKPSDFSDQSTFASFFKGIYASPNNTFTSGEGAILYFNLQSPSSKLKIYYHNNNEDSLICNLVVNEVCARINHFNHDYSKTLINTSIANAGLKDSLLYLQAMAGTKAKIELPFINWYFNKGYIINKAELVITVDESSITGNFSPSPQLFIRGTDETGAVISLADEAVGAVYYGGLYNATTKQYTFTITKYLQSLFNGTMQNRDLQLIVRGNTSEASRVVVFGGNKYKNKMKLLLTYTKF